MSTEVDEGTVAETAAPAATIDTVVAKYIALRDRKKELKDAYDDQVAAIDTGMARCEQYFLAEMQRQGLESLPTKAGVPYKTAQTSATLGDADLFRQWVIANGAWHMVDWKANKTAVVAFREENDDLPPGVNWREELKVNVRRK